MIHRKSPVPQSRARIVLGMVCTLSLLLFCARTPAQAGIDTGSVTGTVAGQHLYGPGPNDLARTKTTGFLNSSAFYTPDPVQQNGQLDFSPLGVRAKQIMGPSWYNIDTSFHKTFNTGEKTQFALGVQVINVLNHTELSNPGTGSYTNPSSETVRGGFGVITGDRHSPRQMQFFGKFFF